MTEKSFNHLPSSKLSIEEKNKIRKRDPQVDCEYCNSNKVCILNSFGDTKVLCENVPEGHCYYKQTPTKKEYYDEQRRKNNI